MGAHDCDYHIRAKNRAEAVRKAKDYQRACQHEHGHGGYSGHLGTAGTGVQFTNGQTFDTQEEARRWILDNHDKWDLPYLVKVGDGDDWLLCGWCSS